MKRKKYSLLRFNSRRVAELGKEQDGSLMRCLMRVYGVRSVRNTLRGYSSHLELQKIQFNGNMKKVEFYHARLFLFLVGMHPHKMDDLMETQNIRVRKRRHIRHLIHD